MGSVGHFFGKSPTEFLDIIDGDAAVLKTNTFVTKCTKFDRQLHVLSISISWHDLFD